MKVRRRRRTDRAAGAVVMPVVVGLLLGGCTGEEPAADDDAAASAAEPGEVGSAPETESLLAEDRGQPPDELRVEDVVVGEGATAGDGDTVEVHHVGLAWSDGERFASSWDAGQPLRFQLGAGEVIDGWDRGLDGMQVGGRRVLTVPPAQAYGERGAGEAVAPGETLVFVVDLLDVDAGDPPADDH